LWNTSNSGKYYEGKLQVLQAIVDVTPGANGLILKVIANPATPSCDLAYTYLVLCNKFAIVFLHFLKKVLFVI